MKVLTDLAHLGRERRPVVLAAGFFDGVHMGHRRVIEKTVAGARQIGGVAWVLTFREHPMRVLRPDAAPPLLTSNSQKLKLLEGMKVNGCLLMPFTRKLAALEPEAFIELLAGSVPTLKRILVGENWRFGRKERGDAAMLTSLAAGHGIKVTVIKPVLRSGRVVSSTRVRGEVTGGSMKEVAVLLGRFFSMPGTVVEGRGVGRIIGFPTANVETTSEVLPPFGVYAVKAAVGRRLLNGVLNIGIRPTFGDAGRANVSIEVHLPGFRGNLYGRDIEVFFVRKLRDEKKFSSVEELKRQIRQDVKAAARIL